MPDRGRAGRPSPTPVRVGPGDDVAEAVADPGAGGTYVLVVELGAEATVEAGALGRRTLPAGDYAYVGSAFGPGGFARAERHRRHLAGDDATVHWHVDALTTRPAASFVALSLVPGVDVECPLARRLPPGPVAGFGSSDCDCRSHLSAVDRGTVGGLVASALDGGDGVGADGSE